MRKKITPMNRSASFEPSPAPTQELASNYYDNTRSVLSVGYGLSLEAPLPPIRLDLFAQCHLLHPRSHTKDAGFVANGPSVAGEALAGGREVETSGWVFAGGSTLGVAF